MRPGSIPGYIRLLIFSVALALSHSLLTASTLLAEESFLAGNLQVMFISLPSGEESALLLETPAGELIRLHTTRAQSRRLFRLPGSTPIELRGRHTRKGFSVSDFFVLGNEGGTISAGDPETAHYAPTFGERKVAVLLVNFLDNTSEPGSPEQAQHVFDEYINDFFLEASYGQTDLVTDVFGWWTLPYESTRCSDPEMHPVSSEILEEADRRGIDLSSYDHLVYVFNEHITGGLWCSNGAGTVSPGYQGRVWRTWSGSDSMAETAFDGVKGIETTIHELGHNLGLWHADRLDCGTEILADNCNTVGYADFYDSMGSGPTGPHFNAFHKERLGWINPDDADWNQIFTVTNSGMYSISPYAESGGTKALKIRRGPNSDGGVDFFYLEFRQPFGWDSSLGQHAYEGVLVHLGNDTTADSSRLLNMTPDDRWEHVLRPGQPFHDPQSDLTIEVVSVSSAEAVLDIFVGRDTTPPSVSINTPSDGEALEKGSAVTILAYAEDESAMGQVDFYVNGILQCTIAAQVQSGSNYACDYRVPKGKSRTLLIEARAIDAAGNSAASMVRTSNDGGSGSSSGDGQGKGRKK